MTTQHITRNGKRFFAPALAAIFFIALAFTPAVYAQAPPVIKTASLPDGLAGASYTTTGIEIETTANISLSVESGDFPQGLMLGTSIDGSGNPVGFIYGTPETAGIYTFTLKATSVFGSGTKEFTITIAMPKPPEITTASLPNGTPSSFYNAWLTTSAEGAEWSIESGSLPQGFELYPNGNILYYASLPYPELGTYTFTVKAENPAGSRTKEFTIKIVLLEISEPPLPDGFVGLVYFKPYSISTIGIASKFSIASGGLPPGLVLSELGYISGTPTTAGSYTFTVKAENTAGDSDTKTFTIKIAMPKEPIITTTSLPNGTIYYYRAVITTSAEYADWSIESGSLPPNVTLGLSWVPSNSATISLMLPPTTAGTYTFTVKATNAAGSDTKELTITIAEESQAPTIVTSSLPDGVVGELYSQNLAATWADVTWSIAGGSLPTDLWIIPSLNNYISGTPTTVGTYTFTLKATNTAGSDTKELTITIKHSEASCLAEEGNVWSNGNCRAKTPADVCAEEGNTWVGGECKTSAQLATEKTACEAEGKIWENGECQTSPIRIPQLAGGNIRIHATGNSIVLQNLPSNAKVEVFGLNGKLVYSNRENRGSDMSISVRTKGVYIVKVSSGSEMKTVKVAVR